MARTVVENIEPLLPLYDSIRERTIAFIDKAETYAARILRGGFVLGVSYIPLWILAGFPIFAVLKFITGITSLSLIIAWSIVGLMWLALTDRTVTKLDMPNATSALTVTVAILVIYLTSAILSAIGVLSVAKSLLASYGAQSIMSLIAVTTTAEKVSIIGLGSKFAISLGALTGVVPVIITQYFGNFMQGVFFIAKQLIGRA